MFWINLLSVSSQTVSLKNTFQNLLILHGIHSSFYPDNISCATGCHSIPQHKTPATSVTAGKLFISGNALFLFSDSSLALATSWVFWWLRHSGTVLTLLGIRPNDWMKFWDLAKKLTSSGSIVRLPKVCRCQIRFSFLFPRLLKRPDKCSWSEFFQCRCSTHIVIENASNLYRAGGAVSMVCGPGEVRGVEEQCA